MLVPLSLGLITLAILAYFVHQAEAETARAAKKRALSDKLNLFVGCELNGCTAVSSYIFTKDPVFLLRYEQTQRKLSQLMNEIEQLLAESGLSEDVPELRALYAKSLAIINTLLAFGEKDRSHLLLENHHAQLMRDAYQGLKQYRSSIDHIQQIQQRIDAKSQATPSIWGESLKTAVIVAAIANVALSMILAVFFSRSIIRRLRLLKENADRLKHGQELLAPISGEDEIARLDHAVHEMAAVLYETMRKQKTIVDNALDVICSLDAQRHFIAVSAGVKQLWGYSPEELVGRQVDSLLIEGSGGLPQLLLDATAPHEHKGITFENTIRHKDGSHIHLLWSARWSPVEQAYFCVSHDISDRKLAESLLQESELRLRTIMETMPISLVIVGKDGLIAAANQTAAEMLHYNSDELTCITLDRLISGCPVDGEPLMDYLKSSYVARAGHLQAFTKGGQSIPIQLSVNEIYYKGVLYFLVAMLDVTQRYEMELLKQQFVNMITNDLSTPLRHVRTVLTGLANSDNRQLTERGRWLIGQSERESERLLSLVNELLDAETLESGGLQLDLSQQNIKPVIDMSVESVRPVAQKRGVSIENLVGEVELRCDSARMVQVMVNILSNAVKFSPPDSQITITSTFDGSWLEVRISDQGRGIPPSHLESIFEKFVQVDADDAKLRHGAGLGLSICKAIVEAHHGTIGVDSEEGRGSTFWWRLPAGASE